jgi:hypothetical protein
MLSIDLIANGSGFATQRDLTNLYSVPTTKWRISSKEKVARAQGQ